jgi:hypothetical protein
MFKELFWRKPRATVSVLTLSVFIWFALPAAAGQEEKVRESFTARAIAIGTSNPPIIPSGRTATLQITITRWTTPEERALLLTQLIENGQ